MLMKMSSSRNWSSSVTNLLRKILTFLAHEMDRLSDENNNKGNEIMQLKNKLLETVSSHVMQTRDNGDEDEDGVNIE